MGVLLLLWLVFAVAVNWGGVDLTAFLALTGNTAAIRRGQIYRLLTAGLMHMPVGPAAVQHIFFALIGLYFMGPALESRWGPRRLLVFLGASSVFAYTTQFLAELLLPVSAARAIGADYYFGAFPVVDALVVAWAASHRKDSILLIVLPVTGTVMLWLMAGYNVVNILVHNLPSEGGAAPFGGMLAGWLFGAGNPVPARRAFLKLRYRWLSARAERHRRARGPHPDLRIVDGGKPDPRDDRPRRRPPTDKRFLN